MSTLNGMGLRTREVKTADYTLLNLVLQYIDDPLSVKTTVNRNNAGTAGGDRGPSYQAGVIRKQTTIPGRSYRGSIHFGAVPESFTTKDQLNAGTGQPAYNTMLADFTTSLAGISDGVDLFYPYVLSTIQSTLTSVPAVITGAWVTSFDLNTRLGTMKRRKERSAA